METREFVKPFLMFIYISVAEPAVLPPLSSTPLISFFFYHGIYSSYLLLLLLVHYIYIPLIRPTTDASVAVRSAYYYYSVHGFITHSVFHDHLTSFFTYPFCTDSAMPRPANSLYEIAFSSLSLWFQNPWIDCSEILPALMPASEPLHSAGA